MSKAVVAATGGTIGVLGGPAAFGLLALIEAGIPVPIPADLVVIALGARVANGDFPVWAAVVAIEAAAALGTTALFLVARGPGRVNIRRLGGRIGLHPDRLQRASDAIERRGRPAMAVGRGTPGLRTLTVVATGGSGISIRRALPALLLGSTVFLQGHLLLGLLFGPAVSDALDKARGPVLAGLAALILGGLALWLLRRGRRGGGQAWTEACCPACLALGMVAAGATGADANDASREAK